MVFLRFGCYSGIVQQQKRLEVVVPTLVRDVLCYGELHYREEIRVGTAQFTNRLNASNRGQRPYFHDIKVNAELLLSLA